MRKVFLDDLPRLGKFGKLINWKECKGLKVSFVYEDLEDSVEIVNYDSVKQELTIKYLNNDYKIKTGDFSKGKIGRIVGKRTDEFKIDIGTRLKDKNRDLLIIGREYREFQRKPNKEGKIYTQKDKYYRYKCNKCGWDEGWTTESLLIKRKSSCACCSNNVIVPEINSIWATDRWMCDLGVSEEDAKKHSKFSGKKIKVKCPDCGSKKMLTISSIAIDKSIRCICSNVGFSYPEKLMYHLLKELNLNFGTQLTKTSFKWCGDYRYDFYLRDYGVIIETHGKQHYEKNTTFKLSLKEQRENDSAKRKLAFSNGVKDYIEVDCRKSELDWIKENIINSELKNILDFSKVDWIKCNELATSNLAKEVCEYWESVDDEVTPSDLEDIFHINAVTIRGYLKKGSKLGWCNYDPKVESKKSYIKNGERNRLRCNKEVEIFKDKISLGIFKSYSELSRASEKFFGVNLHESAISLVCNGKRSHHKGFTFKYVD